MTDSKEITDPSNKTKKVFNEEEENIDQISNRMQSLHKNVVILTNICWSLITDIIHLSELIQNNISNKEEKLDDVDINNRNR